MNSFICEICGKEHEVFRFVRENGNTKLMFTCRRVPKQAHDKSGHIITKLTTQRLPYTGSKLNGPFWEMWSKKRTKNKFGKQQRQLPLMR